MVTRRAIAIVLAVAAVAAALAYLRDPVWLADQTSGLRGWERSPDGGPRYRWSTGHASFFVPADAGAFDLPVSTTFEAGDAPMLVSVSVDGDLVARAVLTDASWTRIHVVLPPRGSRRLRRIDVRTNITRGDAFGVRIGEIEAPPRVARLSRPDANARMLVRDASRRDHVAGRPGRAPCRRASDADAGRG